MLNVSEDHMDCIEAWVATIRQTPDFSAVARQGVGRERTIACRALGGSVTKLELGVAP